MKGRVSGRKAGHPFFMPPASAFHPELPLAERQLSREAEATSTQFSVVVTLKSDGSPVASCRRFLYASGKHEVR